MNATRKLLRRILDDVDSENFMQHIRLMTGSMIVDVVYGIEIDSQDDPFVLNAEIVNQALAIACSPGAFLVDTFLVLKHVLAWLPGASFKRQAAEWKKATTALVYAPFDTVRQLRASGIASPCMVSTLLGELDDSQDNTETERRISEVAAAIYGGGADTTVASLGSFVLAMVLNPGIQQKAQIEIDRVVGPDRLPTFDDMPSLPYITAIVYEVLRWRPVTPLSVPHRLVTDDVYRGYHLPAGTIVFGNTWAILHDETTYHNPLHFIPERFLAEDGSLKPNVRIAESAAFGFGRRICPGSSFAIASNWATISSLLSVFNIVKATVDKGLPIEPSGEYTTGVISHSEPFKCYFKPRSEAAVSLIRLLNFE